MVYERVIKPIFFKMDPEFVHDRTTMLGRVLGSNPLTRSAVALALRYRDPVLRQNVAGVEFENPVGLAAGFDKNCQLMHVLPSVGFGFEEVGSITNLPYGGNPKPRLVRLPKDESIIVYYGLMNEGADKLRLRLCSAGKPRKFAIPVGVSIALTNRHFASQKAKLDDWASGVAKLQDCGSYLTINVSCPNTFDVCDWNAPAHLDPLLRRLSSVVTVRKPIFLKLSADLSHSQLDAIVAVCDRYSRRLKYRKGEQKMPLVTGFVLTNLVKDRTKLKLKSKKSEYASYKGGLSGKVVSKRSLDLTRYVYEHYGDRFVIISVGGIFTAEDAYERIRNGASLVQVITGMIYGGPATIGRMNRGLARLLKKDGFATVSEAVGADCRKTT